jgi:hypothetical protein
MVTVPTRLHQLVAISRKNDERSQIFSSEPGWLVALPMSTARWTASVIIFIHLHNN